MSTRKQTAEQREAAKKFGEVFTPPKVVEEMLDMLDATVWTDPDAIFCEPAFGDGAFVIPIMQRMLAAGHSAESVADRVRGVELQEKHVKTCRGRALELLHDTPDIRMSLAKHLRCGDFIKLFEGFEGRANEHPCWAEPQWLDDAQQ